MTESKKSGTKDLSCDSFNAEEDRIRSAYAKRQSGDRYSWFNPGYLFVVHEREKRVLRLLSRAGFGKLDTKKILEIGCGTGHWLREFVKWGARPENVEGVDLLNDRLMLTRQLCPGGVRVHCGNAARLEFRDASFDLILQSTVFTSVLDPDLKRQIAGEMVRVLKPDGLILWYDFHVDNPRNRDVRGVRKEEISRLFPDCRIQLRRITLAPPIVWRLAPHSWLACYLLERIPLLCTHYLGAIQKLPRDGSG